jgi:hypothetical protein
MNCSSIKYANIRAAKLVPLIICLVQYFKNKGGNTRLEGFNYTFLKTKVTKGIFDCSSACSKGFEV